MWLIGGTVVTAVAVSAVFTYLAINRADDFAQRIEGDCSPLVVIAFRGSGEGNLAPGVTGNEGAPYQYGDSALTTNGWEGITLTGLFDELSRTTYEGFDAATIPVVPVGPASAESPYGYDAIMAVLEASSLGSALTYESSQLLYSATRGAEAATHLMHDYIERSEGCPVIPQFIVTGYSQGAMAARHTAELNPAQVAGVVNIGDPYQLAEAPGVRDLGATGTGLIRWKANDDQGAALDNFYARDGLLSSICHAGDPICEFSPVESLLKLATGNYGDHMDYYTDAYPAEARQDALEIAKIAYELRQRALEAAAAGESVSHADLLDEAATLGAGAFEPGALRSVSLSFAGTPTLFSAKQPGMQGHLFEFDLDGDGVYETTSETGLVWVTFGEDGRQTIGVRITDPDSGVTTETTQTVTVSPEEDGRIVYDDADRDGGREQATEPDTVDTVPAAETPAPGTTTPPIYPVGNPQGPGPVQPAPVPPGPVPPAPTPVPPTPSPAPEPEPTPDQDPEPDPEPDPDPEPTPDPDPDPDPQPDPQPTVQIEGELVPGSMVTFEGDGFAPDSNIMYRIEELEIYGESWTDDTGWFFSEGWIPADALPGTYTMIIEQEDDSWTYDFTVEPGFQGEL